MCRSLQKVLIYLFGDLNRFQHCTGHITTGSWKGRGNLYIQFVGVLCCELPTNDKQLPAFPLEAMPGIEPRPQRWETRVLPLCHHGPSLQKLLKLLILYTCICLYTNSLSLNISLCCWHVFILTLDILFQIQWWLSIPILQFLSLIYQLLKSHKIQKIEFTPNAFSLLYTE